MSDRSAFKGICLLGFLVFLILSSGFVQCIYNCVEENKSWSASSWHDTHVSHAGNCHLNFPEPKQTVSCPDRSCHQSQAHNRSLGDPIIIGYTGPQDPALNNVRLPLPDQRSGQALRQRMTPQPLLLASFQPPAATSQALQSVRTTVLLN